MKTIETVGKDIEQALKAGLAELGCKLDDVEVKILEHPGIFRKARVRMTCQSADVETVEKKTAAAVMRNLEERAARAHEERGANDNRAKNNERNRKNDKRERTDNRANGNGANASRPSQERQDNRASSPARPNNARPETARDKAETPVAVKTAEEKKGEFRRDFRAELAANGNAAPQNNERKEQNKRPEQPRETASPEVLAAAKANVSAYLTELTALMGMPSEVTVEIKNGGLDAALTSDDGHLVGSRGETLEAIEYLTMLTANGGDGRQVRLNLDCGGYRAKAEAELARSAIEAADKAVATGKRVELPPMSSSGRRIVHAALGEREDVITRSEGREPTRYIVVMPKRGGGSNQSGGNRRPNNGGYNNNRKKHWNNNQGRKTNGKDSGAE